MCSKFRFVPDVTLAERLVRDGLLGKVVLYENVFCSRVPMAGRWNADPALSGGGVLIDNGAHAADLAKIFVGRVERLSAHFGPRVQDLPVEDTVRVVFEAESGCVGTIDLSWSIHRNLDWYVALHGSKGTLRLGWKESAYVLLGGDWTPFGSGYDKKEALRAQLAEFAKVVRGLAEPRPSAEDALDSVRLIDAAYHQRGS
jgi:predicted dehydrogenase